jgi:hypothetical protein
MNGVLPDWLAQWFGVDADGGHGIAWRLLEFWNWPAWATICLVVGSAGLIFAAYWFDVGAARRRTRIVMAALRMTAVLLLLAMIARFVLAIDRTDLPTVIVVVDVSRSMNWPDGVASGNAKSNDVADWRERLARLKLDQPTRLNIAKSLLLDPDEGLFEQLAGQYRVEIYVVADAAELLDTDAQLREADPRGEHSRLGDGIRSALEEQQGRAVAAVIALTDGITTDGKMLTDVAADCRRRGAPLFAIALGSHRPPRDVELAEVAAPDLVFAGDVVYFDSRLVARGFQGRSVQVSLRLADSNESLAETTIAVASDEDEQPVHLAWQPTEPGQFRCVVEAKPLDGEFNTKNNTQQLSVTVIKQTVRVLLVDGQPRYEYRFLKHFLEREPSVEVRAVLADADLDITRTDATMLSALPVRQDELFAYDVVVIGDVDPVFLGATFMGALRDFVEKRAGGVLFIAGPRQMPASYAGTPLELLLPVEPRSNARAAASLWTDVFTPVPTSPGATFPQMRLADSPKENSRVWSELPGQFWYFDAPRPKPGALVLAEHPAERGEQSERLPLIATLHATWPGKTLFHGFDSSYRWQSIDAGRNYARFWLQTIRYLAHTKLLGQDRLAELTTDRRQYRRGAPVEIQLRFLATQDAPPDEQPVSVVVESGDNRRTVELRRTEENAARFVGTATDLGDGNYVARLVAPKVEGLAPTTDFAILPPPGEMDRVEADIAELTSATRVSGGKLYRADETAELVDDLPEGRHAPTTRLPDVPLWNSWPVPLLFLVLLATEWILRKRHGML